jgi:hypothetical protein
MDIQFVPIPLGSEWRIFCASEGMDVSISLSLAIESPIRIAMGAALCDCDMMQTFVEVPREPASVVADKVRKTRMDPSQIFLKHHDNIML